MSSSAGNIEPPQGKAAKENLKVPVRVNDFYALNIDPILNGMSKAFNEVKDYKWMPEKANDWAEDAKKTHSEHIHQAKIHYISKSFIDSIDKKNSSDKEIVFLTKAIHEIAEMIVTNPDANNYKELFLNKIKKDFYDLISHVNVEDDYYRNFLGLTQKDSVALHYVDVTEFKSASLPDQKNAKKNALLSQVQLIHAIKCAIATMQGGYENSPHGLMAKRSDKIKALKDLTAQVYVVDVLDPNVHAITTPGLVKVNPAAIDELVKLVIRDFNKWCGKSSENDIKNKLRSEPSEHHVGRMYAIFLLELRDIRVISDDLWGLVTVKVSAADIVHNNKKNQELYPSLEDLLRSIKLIVAAEAKATIESKTAAGAKIPVNPAERRGVKDGDAIAVVDKKAVPTINTVSNAHVASVAGPSTLFSVGSSGSAGAANVAKLADAKNEFEMIADNLENVVNSVLKLSINPHADNIKKAKMIEDKAECKQLHDKLRNLKRSIQQGKYDYVAALSELKTHIQTSINNLYQRDSVASDASGEEVLRTRESNDLVAALEKILPGPELLEPSAMLLTHRSNSGML